MNGYKHPNWQKRRLEVFQRDEFTCQFCDTTDTELHLHHLEYSKDRELWEADSDSLITLCKDCHDLVTDLKRRFGKVMSDSIGFEVADVFLRLLESKPTTHVLVALSKLESNEELLPILVDETTPYRAEKP